MFNDTLGAKNVVLIFQATLAQGAAYLLFLMTSKRQHKACAFNVYV